MTPKGEPLCGRIPVVIHGLVFAVGLLIVVAFALGTNALRPHRGVWLAIVLAMVASAAGFMLKDFCIDRPRRK